MQLPKGITGFDRHISDLDKPLLKMLQSELKQKAHCKILNILPPGTSNNYYTLDLEYYSPTTHESSLLSLLINGYAMFWAITETAKSSWMNLHFIEPPKEIQRVLEPFLQEVPLDTLLKKVDPSHLLELGKHELRQITYWNSEQLGEIIFNGYD